MKYPYRSGALSVWAASEEASRDFRYWDTVATARETYCERIRLGLQGETGELHFVQLMPILAAFQARVQAGIRRAVEMNTGIPPTYLAYTVTDWEVLAATGRQARPYVRAR